MVYLMYTMGDFPDGLSEFTDPSFFALLRVFVDFLVRLCAMVFLLLQVRPSGRCLLKGNLGANGQGGGPKAIFFITWRMQNLSLLALLAPARSDVEGLNIR